MERRHGDRRDPGLSGGSGMASKQECVPTGARAHPGLCPPVVTPTT